MMPSTRRRAALLVGALAAVAACSPSPPVAVERRDASDGQLTVDDRAPNVEADRTEGSDPVPAPATTLEWGSCASFEIPSSDDLGTARWECTTLVAPMDPFDGAVDDVVELALTRHPATGDRRGSIVLNPGGPGGDGLSTAWAILDDLPAEILRGFDVVAWDPRGIGQSTPKIDCDDAVPPSNPDFISACVELTGPLSAHLAAPYSAEDLEAIRVALGEEQLNYLGYSYGTLIGAAHAAAHPSSVGGFVLDGAVDPRVGGPDGPSSGGFPSLADDGYEAARDRFAELCNATDECLFSLDAAQVLDDLGGQVPSLPTADYDGSPDRVDREAYDEFIENTLLWAGDWELVATALEDADRGDASAMASLIGGPDGDGGTGDDADDEIGETDFAEANFMIYCADLKSQLDGPAFCDDMPANARELSPVVDVDVERPILVIGTEWDPLTPGYHAIDLAAALGDATHIIWEGVGHTAFPGWTPCIDDAVAAQFLGEVVPPDGTRCSFLFGIEDDTTLGDELFGHGDLESEFLLEVSLDDEPGVDDPVCVARDLNDDSNQVISHVILDVTSDEADAAVAEATAVC